MDTFVKRTRDVNKSPPKTREKNPQRKKEKEERISIFQGNMVLLQRSKKRVWFFPDPAKNVLCTRELLVLTISNWRAFGFMTSPRDTVGCKIRLKI